YPLDWSPVCTNENACFSNDPSRFSDANAEIFGISTDSTWCHKAWKDALKLKHNPPVGYQERGLPKLWAVN
ncbi:thiol-specific antioxidant protein, partial [mine drainage metagenome]